LTALTMTGGWLGLRPPRFLISYEDGSTALASAGPTLLDISRQKKIGHVSVCGGNGRCSTCRVHIVQGAETLPAPVDPDARLFKPAIHNARLTAADETGVVRQVAILFIDLRDFTKLSETKLAFDVVFILNTIFAAVASAIEGAGGRVDKYMGDGVMAVFELAGGLESSSRAAIQAMLEIDAGLDGVNKVFGEELKEPLRLAMGLHVGQVILGRIGSGAAASTTAVGRVVNVASRLVTIAKQRDVEIVMSEYCAKLGGINIARLTREDVDVRGLDNKFSAVLVSRAAVLR
jgi:adenylate cyclase